MEPRSILLRNNSNIERAFLKANELGGIFRHVKPLDLVDLRATKVIRLMRLEDDLFPRQVLLKGERASTNGIP